MTYEHVSHSFLSFIIIFLFISVFGSIGNFLTCLVYWKKKDKQTASFYILVLALSDFVVCSVFVPITIYMESYSFEIDNIYFCKLYFFLTTTTVPFSCLLMTAIAIDRYMNICYIHVNKALMTVKKAKIIIVCLLITSCFLGIIPSINSVIKPEKAQSNENDTDHEYWICIVDTESNYGYFVMPFKNFYDFIYLMSVIIVTFLYIAIYKEIRIRNKIKAERIKKLNNDNDTKLLNLDFLREQCRKDSIAMSVIKKKHEEPKPSMVSNINSTITNNHNNNNNIVDTSLNRKKKKKKHAINTSNSLTRILPFLISIKDTRIAFMLAMVTFFYMISYFPSILATRNILSNENLFIVYLYLSNAMINPVIYSFMNQTFRKDLIKIVLNSKNIFKKNSQNYNNSVISTYSVGYKRYSVAV